MKTNNLSSFETKLIHAGEPSPRIAGAVSLPIFQSSTYEYAGEDSYHAIRYIRLNNTPNHISLHNKLASLEGAGRLRGWGHVWIANSRRVPSTVRMMNRPRANATTTI